MGDFFKRDTEVARVGSGDETQIETPLQSAIRENALGPRRVQSDAGSVEQHSIQDQIDAERFLQSQKATSGKGFPIRFHKIKPGGTT